MTFVIFTLLFPIALAVSTSLWVLQRRSPHELEILFQKLVTLRGAQA